MSGREEAVASLKARLDHDFTDETLLEQALTHASGTAARVRGNNERLEFLGDRVLGLVIAHILYERHDDMPEGELARMLNAMVRRAMCTKVAERLDIGPALKLAGKGQKRTVITDNILGDALEALIGAIYLDGGLEAASRFIRQHWKDALEKAPGVRKDPKTALQEWAAARSLDVPAYEITGQSGPDHAPEFTVQLTVQGRLPAEGVAGSRRMAEQNAAEAFLVREKIWK
jgi:ribonuclease III